MAAANTDKIRKKKSLFSTTLSAGISAVDTSLTLASASGLASDTAITLTIDRVDANGTSTPSARERVTGTYSGSGSTIAALLRGEDGGAGAVHSSGAVVEDIWEADTWNDFCDAFLVGHNQDGTHDFAVVYDSNGNETVKLVGVALAVNEVSITNAATGNGPSLAATGGDTNIPIILKGKGTGPVRLGQATSTDVRLEADQPIGDSSGNEFIKFTKAASAVNELTVANAATGAGPEIQATGGDTNIDLNLQPKGTGATVIKGTATSAAELRLSEDTDNGTNYMGLKAPAAVTANKTLTLPDGDGSANQVLKTDGSGNLGWATSSALSSKTGTFTRDMTAASGNVSYTGVGFVPTAIHLAGVVGSVCQSVGYCDSALGEQCIFSAMSAAYTQGGQSANLCLLVTASSAFQTALVASFDADGFTLTWGKTNSPTGTANLVYIAHK